MPLLNKKQISDRRNELSNRLCDARERNEQLADRYYRPWADDYILAVFDLNEYLIRRTGYKIGEFNSYWFGHPGYPQYRKQAMKMLAEIEFMLAEIEEGFETVEGGP